MDKYSEESAIQESKKCLLRIANNNGGGKGLAEELGVSPQSMSNYLNTLPGARNMALYRAYMAQMGIRMQIAQGIIGIDGQVIPTTFNGLNGDPTDEFYKVVQMIAETSSYLEMKRKPPTELRLRLIGTISQLWKEA